jgi:hypothetical protein
MARAVLLTIALVLLTSASARASGEIYTLAGSGTLAPTRDGTTAIRAGLPQEVPVAALPGGGFLVADGTHVWRVDPQGLIHLAAANLHDVDAVAALPDGGFLVGDLTRVCRVDPQGQIHLTDWPGGASAIAALPDGGFVFADGGSHVHRVGPDGRIAAIPDFEADDLSPAPDGSVLLADRNNARIERLGTDGNLSVVMKLPKDDPPTHIAALPDGGYVYTTSERVTRVRPDGSTFVLAGAGPFIRTAPEGLQQRLSGQSAQRADLHYVFDLAATPDGGVLISHGRIDAFDEGGFIDYVAPAAPAVLGAAILRDRDRVFTPGGMQNVSVSLTAPASVTVTVAGRSVTRDLPAGVTKVAVPSPGNARPERVSLVATAGTLRAYDDVRIFPPGWLPTETGALVAGIIASDVDHCHRFGARRIDCLTNKPDYNCHSVTVRLSGDRLRWAEYGPCAIRSHPRLAHAPRPLTRANSGCGYCSSGLFGRIDEAALVPAT